MSDTPRTDAVDIPDNWDTPDKLANLCRTLERELARYKRLEQKLRDYSDVVDRPDGEGVRPNQAMSILSEWENGL